MGGLEIAVLVWVSVSAAPSEPTPGAAFQIPANFGRRDLKSDAPRFKSLAQNKEANDGDDDGLTDDEERSLKTDPRAGDTDGDGILDGWEVHRINGLDLPSLGASPLHKDIFIEMDFMQGPRAPANLRPSADVVRRIIEVFANAPVLNPDGRAGIALHLEFGNAVPHDPDLNPYLKEFARLKKQYFDPRKAPVYHYMIWADRYGASTSSGMSMGIPHSDFFVTLGGWQGGGTDAEKVGTFVHELGHNLGLHHGGLDDEPYKPNHLSVMNYWYQTDGVPVDGGQAFTFQRFDLPELDERALLTELTFEEASRLTKRP